MEIEKLTEDDLTDLAELFEQFWNEQTSLEKMKLTYNKIRSDSKYILLVGKKDGILAGFVMGVICEELYGECRPFMVVEDVIVNQQFRRNGIGTTLMREIERIATERNCCQTIFVTESNRKDAVGFYQSIGYDANKYTGFKKQIGRG